MCVVCILFVHPEEAQINSNAERDARDDDDDDDDAGERTSSFSSAPTWRRQRWGSNRARCEDCNVGRTHRVSSLLGTKHSLHTPLV